MPPHLKVHHLHYSQSERIPWLLSELALSGHPVPHTLVTYNRSPMLSPPELLALHPMGAAPVLTDDSTGLNLGESSAIVEYILDTYTPTSPLKPRPGDPGYAAYLYWFHWANGSFQPLLMRCFYLSQLQPDAEHPLIKNTIGGRLPKALGFLDTHLREEGVQWLAGPEGGFTAADVMLVFSLGTVRRFWGYTLAGYEGILGYLKRVGEREGFREAMKNADPQMDWTEAMGPEAPPRFKGHGV